MKAEDLFVFPAIDVLGAGIPGYDIALRIERNQREVANGIERRPASGARKAISGRQQSDLPSAEEVLVDLPPTQAALMQTMNLIA